MTRLGVGSVLVDGHLVAADVDVVDGRIKAITPPTIGSTTIAAPGLVDLQVNGFAGVDFAGCTSNELEDAAEALWAAGTSCFLPTLTTASVDRLCGSLEVIAQVQRAGRIAGRAEIGGAHLEGPFLSHLRLGAHDGTHRLDPDPDVLERLLAAGDGRTIRMMTLAPELVGSAGLVARLLKASATVAAGHSDATAEQAQAGFDAGITAVTHLGNAMAPFHHRAPGLFGAALVRDDVTATLIADGQHVADDTVRLVFAAKKGRVALVSDAVSLAGTTEPTGRLADASVTRHGDAARHRDGGLAGGLTTVAEMLHRIVEVGIDRAAALASATLHPRRIGGFAQSSGVEVGSRADLVLLDADLGLIEVIGP